MSEQIGYQKWHARSVFLKKFDAVTRIMRSGVKKEYSIDYDREIGGGNFARVYHGFHRITNSEVAIKKTMKCNQSEVELSRWHNEVKVLRLLSHPNCAEIYDSFESRRSLYIVMSFAAGGQLLDRIAAKGRFIEAEAAGCVQQILVAVEYLHSLGVVHRDLKPENIVYKSPPPCQKVVIVDFNLACLVEPAKLKDHAALFETLCGTQQYIAPEILAGRCYGKECDLWSIGVILFLMLCGTLPFLKAPLPGTGWRVTFPEPLGSELSTASRTLMHGLLRAEPVARLTCRQCLSWRWVMEGGVVEGELEDSQLSEPPSPQSIHCSSVPTSPLTGPQIRRSMSAASCSSRTASASSTR